MDCKQKMVGSGCGVLEGIIATFTVRG